MPNANCTGILLCCALFALTTGAAIHREARKLDQLNCLTISDEARLGFQNKEDSYMSDKLVALGERVELRCQVVGAPQATIRWKHNGIFLDKQQIRDHHVVIENGDMPVIGIGTTVSKLIIDCADSERTGHYTCVAENHCSESIETSAIVAIKDADGEEQFSCPVHEITAGAAPELTFWTDSLIERPEATVVLFCRAAGHPRPVLEWFLEGDDNENRKVTNDESHLLLKSGDLLVRGHDSKIGSPFVGYKCVAKNVHGSDSMETVIIFAENA